MDVRALIAMLGLAALAGCAGDDSTVLHFQQTQCEENPWGAGADEAAIEAHYGVEIMSAAEVDDGRGYASVCGGASSTHVQVEARGDLAAMTADGWQEGPVQVEDA